MSTEETGEWSKADLHKKLQTALDRNIQLAIENERLKLKSSSDEELVEYIHSAIKFGSRNSDDTSIGMLQTARDWIKNNPILNKNKS